MRGMIRPGNATEDHSTGKIWTEGYTSIGQWAIIVLAFRFAVWQLVETANYGGVFIAPTLSWAMVTSIPGLLLAFPNESVTIDRSPWALAQWMPKSFI